MPIGVYSPPAGPAPYQKPLYRKPLDDDEADGLAKRMLGHSTSLLQSGLYALDTPGAAIRGGLGSLVGATASDGDRVSGRDLTDAVGLTSKHDQSFWASVPGFGAELATDPLNYLSFGTKGAMTASGKALSKTGTLRGWSRRDLLSGFDELESNLVRSGHSADEIAHMRNQGARIATPAHEQAVTAAGAKLQPGQALAGLAGIGLPFRSPSVILGKGGPLASNLAGRLDAGIDKLKYGTTVGRWANALFDPSVREATGGVTQRAMAEHGTPALEAARIAARGDTAGVTQQVHAALGAGFGEDDVLRAARLAGEGASPRNVPAGLHPLAAAIGQAARAPERRQLAESMEVGIPLHDAADPFAAYLPRQGVDLDAARRKNASGPNWTSANPGGGVGVKPGNLMPMATSANYHRDDLWRAIPGGTEQVNDWVKKYAGNPQNLAPDVLAKLLKRDMAIEHQAVHGPITREVGKQLDTKAADLAQRLGTLSPDYSAHGIGLYSNNLVGDVTRSGEQHARTIASARAAMGLIGDHARLTQQLAPDAVPISDVLDKLGMITRAGSGSSYNPANLSALGAKAGPDPIQGALLEAQRQLAKQGAVPAHALQYGDLADLRTEVNKYALPRHLYDELIAAHTKWNTPEVAKGPLGFFDQLTGSFKNLSYPLWPASHVRNAASALINNATNGTKLADHLAQAKLMRGTITAADLGKIVPDLPPGLSDEAARQWVRNEQYATAKIYDGHSGQFDLDQTAARLQSQRPGQITPDMAGTGRAGGGSFLGDTAKLVGGKLKEQAEQVAAKVRHPLAAPSPLQMAGIMGGQQDFPGLELGRTVGGNIEDLFRGARYLAARRSGTTAAEAGRAVRDLHFDYQDATQFEKQVMRRLVPFYTFSRHNLPLQASNLLHAPGQVASQMRAMSVGRDRQDYVPDYLGGGVAIPTGPERDGKRQFISSLGTPLEEALERFQFKGGMPDVKGTALQFMSSMNPILKAPLEQLFDTQFHTGRKLSGLRPPTTASALGHLIGDDNPQILSQILANTPATRFVSGLDKLIDDRKSPLAKVANLATGVKVTDVDLEKQQAAEVAQARNELLAGMPHVKSHTNYYVRPEDAAGLTPEEVELLRLQATAASRARERIGVRPR